MKKKKVQVKGCFRKNLAVFLGVMVFFCTAGTLQATASRYQPIDDGSIVRDKNTGLEWKRCPYGQRWLSSGCRGEAWGGNWYQAVEVTVMGGFRIPTIDELKTLTPYDRYIFPGVYKFWSSSPYTYASRTDFAWYLNFYHGDVNHGSKKGNFQLRLVRSGQ